MKREIYIMEQRLHNLKKEQKRKVEEMEKQVDHRDILRTKGQAVQAATGSGQKGKTKATLQKENSRLVGELRQRKQDAQKRDQQIKDCLQNTEKTAVEVDSTNRDAEELKQQLSALQANIKQRASDRGKSVDEKQRKTRTLQRYLDAYKTPSQYRPIFQPEQVALQQENLEDKKLDIGKVIQELAVMFPQYGASLQEIVADL